MSNLIMSWSECSIELGKTGAGDAMAATLKTVGVIADKSTTLASEDGEVLEAKATGGKIVAREAAEGKITLTTKIKEPEYEFLSTLIGATVNAAKDELTIKSLIVSGDYSVKLTPKNIGGTGLKIRKANISYKDGFSEEEGMFGELVITVLACADGELYTKYKKKTV
ncbi:MAG: hypothetical protein RSB93_00775 [Rikenellaceae bacterium]